MRIILDAFPGLAYLPFMPARTREEFIERYRIVSTTGRCYDRVMLLSAATRCWLARATKVSRRDLAAVIDDDTFLRLRCGEVPARVAEAVCLEAISRRA